jgi:hypothetical protein
MKRIFLIATLMVLINLQPTFAQAKRSMNSLPLVDPVTQCALRYYYYPNIEAYFDTREKLFHFKVDGEWTTAEEIPLRLRRIFCIQNAKRFNYGLR